MALIRDRKLACDSWKLLDPGTQRAADAARSGGVIVPLSFWREHRDALLAARAELGVWLDAADDPAEIADDLEHVRLIAIRFPSFTDGRGYTTARLLRERYDWRGELRAIGDVQRDQIFYLSRCGFDAFALREGEDVRAALEAFRDFSDSYQAAVDQPLPLYRRREESQAPAR